MHIKNIANFRQKINFNSIENLIKKNLNLG